jgi:hypothetical protein
LIYRSSVAQPPRRARRNPAVINPPLTGTSTA